MIAALAALALVATPAPAGGGASASPPVTVDAEEIQYLYKEGKVVFTGKPLVKLTREDAVLTCQRLVAENDDAGKIRKAVCTGDVRLVRGTRIVTCETATYEERNARVTCAGNPVLRDGDSVMRGEVLVYDLAADEATLTGAKGTIVPKAGQGPTTPRKQKPAPATQAVPAATAAPEVAR